MIVDLNELVAGNVVGQLGERAEKHWHELYEKDFEENHHIYTWMTEIISEITGRQFFDAKLALIFQSLISKRYYSNDPLFLSYEEVKTFKQQGEKDIKIGECYLAFPQLMNSSKKSEDAITSFGFLYSKAVSGARKGLNANFLAGITVIISPFTLIKPELLNALKKEGLFDDFINNMRSIIKKLNHDFLHGFTNPTRIKKIQKEFDYRSKYFLSNFMNPDLSDNGLVVEECAVIEMNRLIFEKMRATKHSSVEEIASAVSNVTSLISQLHENGEPKAAIQAASLLKGFLNFLFDKDFVNKTPQKGWGDMIRTAPTRSDLRLCIKTEEEKPAYMCVVLNAKKTEESEPARQMTAEENDLYCINLIQHGKLALCHPVDAFKKLAEAIDYDLGGAFFSKAERQQIKDIAYPDSKAVMECDSEMLHRLKILRNPEDRYRMAQGKY